MELTKNEKRKVLKTLRDRFQKNVDLARDKKSFNFLFLCVEVQAIIHDTVRKGDWNDSEYIYSQRYTYGKKRFPEFYEAIYQQGLKIRPSYIEDNSWFYTREGYKDNLQYMEYKLSFIKKFMDQWEVS